MELVGPDDISDEERAIQALLNEHPVLKKRLTCLLNGYRELVHSAMEGADPADVLRANVKKENEMRRLGIRLLQTMADWMEIRD